MFYHHLVAYYTTTSTTVLRPFVRDYPGELVPEGQTILDFAKAETIGWQRHQLDHMQVICTSLQTDNQANTSITRVFYGPDAFPVSNQQYKSTEDNTHTHIHTT